LRRPSSPRRLPPRSTLFPYTTLFRSLAIPVVVAGDLAAVGAGVNNRRVMGIGRDIAALTAADRVPVRTVDGAVIAGAGDGHAAVDRKSTRLNSSHLVISYAVFCLKKK